MFHTSDMPLYFLFCRRIAEWFKGGHVFVKGRWLMRDHCGQPLWPQWTPKQWICPNQVKACKVEAPWKTSDWKTSKNLETSKWCYDDGYVDRPLKTAAPATSHSRLLVMADAVDVGDSGIGLSPISGRRGEGACRPIPKTISPTAPKKQRA